MSDTDDQALVPGSAPLMHVFQSDMTRIGITHWPLKGPPDVVRDALGNPPQLVTKIVWEQAALPDRLAAVNSGMVSSDHIVSNDMTLVFTEPTLRFLSAWQSLINSHAVWFADYDLGKLASDLIERGYLMAAPNEGTSWHGNTVNSRHMFVAGTPGSAQFVAAMMGAEYAHWLSNIP